MGIIYKVENEVNGKIYIGQTCGSLKRRWWKHQSDARRFEMPGSLLHRAIKKYGVESFNISIIEDIPNELLDEREIYWINFYDSYKSGYNLTKGGMGHKCIPHEDIIKLWDAGRTTKEIAEIMGCGKTVVGNVLQEYDGYSGSEGDARGRKKHQRNVNQYDLDGNLIASFQSIADAHRTTHISSAHIVQVCKGSRNFAGGFRWGYAECAAPNVLGKKRPKPHHAPFVQYDLSGKEINRFLYMNDAAIETGIDAVCIGRCCRGKNRTAGGFQWRFETDQPPGEYIPAVPHGNPHKSVDQCDGA